MDYDHILDPSRVENVRFLAGVALLIMLAWPVYTIADSRERLLSFYNTHTHEHLTVIFKDGK